MHYQIVRAEPATEEDMRAIVVPLIEHNESAAPPPRHLNLALLIRDAEGKTLGGLWGRFGYDWLFVDYLAVPSALRGQGLGTQLLQQAEQIAIERECVGLWLDTFSFQARPFYEKLGYNVFGQLEDYPRGHTRYWLQKRFYQP